MTRFGRVMQHLGVLVSGMLVATQAQIMSVDLGHEFFKVALMRQGVPLEIVLNPWSARKTTNAVSFFEQIRTFGDDAVGQQGKAPAKVPMFFHSLLGQNFTSAADVQSGGKWWEAFALGDKFYKYSLEYDEERGVPTFMLTGENASFGEEALASVIQFARKMAEDSADGKTVRDLVVTVSPDAGLRQRQAIVAAGEIAGCRVVTLVHEGSAFAVHRAVDYLPEKNATDVMLFYNLGSRKAEVSIVRFTSRSAGMVAGKTAPVVTVLGTATDYTIGGHLMDLKLAQAMLNKFQTKYPKLADGIEKAPRALRKLLSQAQKTKAILSSNKQALFSCESLFEDHDFQIQVLREEFETMCKDMLDSLTNPVEKALASAGVTMQDITHVEVVGGAWRVPKVQEILTNFFEQHGGEKKLTLGQHLNGEEAAAMGAALIAANSSTSFRVKKIFFTDISHHEYSVQVVSLKPGDWEKNYTTLYSVGTPYGGKKKLAFTLETDFIVKLFEDGVLMSEFEISGLEDLLAGKWAAYNTTGPPKIAVSVPLGGNGIVEIKTPTATVEETYWVNVTKKIKKNANATNATNATSETSANSSSGDAGTEAEKEEKEEKEEDEAEASADDKASTDDKATSDGNGTVSGNESVADDVEIVQKQKKRKHEKKLKVERRDYFPKAMTPEQIKASKDRLEVVKSKEADIKAMAGMKNALEAAIYDSRDKMEREDIIKVSTEEQREEVTKVCTEYEEWMYEGGSTKSDYEQRITKLEDLLGPMTERALEHESRPDIPDMVKDGIDEISKMAKHIKKNMTWINENKTQAANDKLSEFETWWKKKVESQASLPLYEAPAYTKKEVVEKLGKVRKEFNKIMSIKKPKDKAKPKNSTKAAKEEEAKPDLPTDPEAIEKELKELQQKKGEAVDKEDFDTAQKLKQREKALRAHLAELKAKSEL